MSTPAVTVTMFEGRLACQFCGQGVADGPTTSAEILGRRGQEEAIAAMRIPPRPVPIEFRTCPTCRERREAAERCVSVLPGVERQFGRENAVDWLASALDALVAMGRRPSPPSDEGAAFAMIRHLSPVGEAAHWSSHLVPFSRVRADPQSSAAYPWSHLDDELRQVLRSGYGALLAEKVARTAPPVRLTPPEGLACMFCGVGHVTRSAIQVLGAGGVEAVRAQVWHHASASPSALDGGGGPERLHGYLCPPCDAARREAGAIGYRAVETAYEQHLKRTGRDDEARAMRVEGVPVRLVAWAGADHRARRAGRDDLSPGEKPWEHVG